MGDEKITGRQIIMPVMIKGFDFKILGCTEVHYPSVKKFKPMLWTDHPNICLIIMIQLYHDLFINKLYKDQSILKMICLNSKFVHCYGYQIRRGTQIVEGSQTQVIKALPSCRFFQHIPDKASWDYYMTWGHVVSDDLIHWRHLPIALRPSKEGADSAGCWSGACVVNVRKEVVAVYTGVQRQHVVLRG